SITIILALICLTIFNKHFVIMSLNDDYYEIVMNNIKNDMSIYNINYELDINDVKKDTKKFINSYYTNKDFVNKMVFDEGIIVNDEVNDIYSRDIRFNDIFRNYNISIIREILYLITITLIILVGNLFIHTKKKHDIKDILIISGVIIIIIYGILSMIMSIDNPAIYMIISKFMKYLLGVGILLLDIVFINNIWKRIQ
ncbi:MAG TPA: hypothetical protein PLB45_02255, partial [Bacilli bacterium]|nr:hypothetical protein [Bacilli bacterium]